MLNDIIASSILQAYRISSHTVLRLVFFVHKFVASNHYTEFAAIARQSVGIYSRFNIFLMLTADLGLT